MLTFQCLTKSLITTLVFTVRTDVNMGGVPIEFMALIFLDYFINWKGCLVKKPMMFLITNKISMNMGV